MSAITEKVQKEIKDQVKVKKADAKKAASPKKAAATSSSKKGEPDNFNPAGFNKLWDELVRQQSEMSKLIENHNKLGQMVQSALKEFGVKYSKMADTINHNAEETENCRSLAGAVECKLRKVEERSSRANAALLKSCQAQIAKATKDLEKKLISEKK